MMASLNNRSRVWFLAAAAGVALDQLSKATIGKLLPLGSAVVITDFFNIVHVLNSGAAFSFLADQSGWQRWVFSLIAAAASVVLTVLLRRGPRAVDAAGYALILAGAVSNLIDRVMRGAVVDWIDLYWKAWHWPAFNLADVWITTGVALIIVAGLRTGATRADLPEARG